MKEDKNTEPLPAEQPVKFYLPPLGHRIIKTATAVFICLVLHILSGYRGSVASAAISAIICMQPYATDSRSFAIERIMGTLQGSLWGFAYLLIMPAALPVNTVNMLLAYGIMALFVLLSMYAAVVMKRARTASLVAIVFLGMVIDYPFVQTSLYDTLAAFADTLIGVSVAIFVNIYHLPRQKHPERLFFVRTMDLVPDRYSQLPSAVHITLDHLFNDGAKICLVSRWAPAFIISQMGLLDVNVPLIVMDGAAIYDIQESKYLEVVDIPHDNAARLSDIILGFGSFCSFYTVRERSLCIYRNGPISEAEREEYRKMKRSPYRNYMEGSYSDADRIAFMRVIDTPERINELKYLIQSVLPPGMFRMEQRQEAQFPDYSGLYFYDPRASVHGMKERVLRLMEEREGRALEAVDIVPKLSSYLPEQHALILLARLKKAYEPIRLWGRRT